MDRLCDWFVMNANNVCFPMLAQSQIIKCLYKISKLDFFPVVSVTLLEVVTFLLTLFRLWLVCWSVSLLVCRSVCHSFAPKRAEVRLPCSYMRTGMLF